MKMMTNYFDLPIELQLIVIAGFDDKTLIDLVGVDRVGGKLRVCHPAVRVELFRRRSEEALNYQNSLMGSWLKYWPTAQKLSFIKNDADKREWLGVLDAALCNPNSSQEHKIRCCLLINKLFPIPSSQDITPIIVKNIFADISKGKDIGSRIKAFAPEFSEDTVQQVIATLTVQSNDARSMSRSAAIANLGAMAPYAPQPRRDEMVEPLINRLGGDDRRVREFAATALGAIAAHISQTQCDAIVTPLLNRLGDLIGDVRLDTTPALSAIAPYVSQPQRDAIVGHLLMRALGDDEGDMRLAAQSMTVLIPDLSDTQLKSLLALPRQDDAEIMVLQLIAQTRLHIRQLDREAQAYVEPAVCASNVSHRFT